MGKYQVIMTCIYMDTVEADDEDDAVFQMEQMYSDDWEEVEVEELEEES